MELVTLESARLACAIHPLGAELHRLTGQDGRAWLWHGDAAWWGGRAPILFPVVGMLAGGAYRWKGRTYRLDKHGFARRRQFALLAQDEASAIVRLSADAETRAVYPFDFELDLDFALGDALVVTATVRNRGEGPMPFSFGFHPALRWPRGGEARLIFDRPEDGPVWRMDGDGLLARTEPLPGDGHVMPLRDALFADDAMIVRDVASRSLRFEHREGSVRVGWSNLSDLGIWTKPGAPFLCVEPWAGFNDPAGFDGELGDKPGIVMLAPGAEWEAAMTIEPVALPLPRSS